MQCLWPSTRLALLSVLRRTCILGQLHIQQGQLQALGVSIRLLSRAVHEASEALQDRVVLLPGHRNRNWADAGRMSVQKTHLDAVIPAED